jgi:uncharacterized protein YceH (UPF0502 family)
MIQLSPDECRVLGTLIEKAHTTPAQYPLTLNALTTGVNQKSNRFPVVSLDEDRVLDALEGLKRKELVRDVLLSGSRVTKYRHIGREALGVDTPQLVVLAELLLRGPQTPGELRQNASRMHPLASLEVVQGVLGSLIERAPGPDGARPPPLVREVAPAPGTRAARYAQLICPTLHRVDEPDGAPPETDTSSSKLPDVGADLLARIDSLEQQVTELRAALSALSTDLGQAPDTH